MIQAPTMSNMQLLARYSPQTQSALNRSQYLAAALQALEQSGRKIQSPLELASDLGAVFLAKRGGDKANSALIEAMRADQDAAAAPSVNWLKGQAGRQPPEAPPASQESPQAPPSIDLPPMADAPRSAYGASLDQRKKDMLTRLLIGEDPTDEGQKAVASVVLNRAKRSGMDPLEVIQAKGQFEPIQNPEVWARLAALAPNDPAYQRASGNLEAVMQGGPTTDADHFYAPAAQKALGRPMPPWDNGTGQDIGRSRFLNLGYSAPPGYSPSVQPGDGVGASPLLAPPPPPQMAPQQSVPQGGRGPTQEEIQYATELLANPLTYQEGVSYAGELRKRYAAPPTYRDVQVNGLPYAYDQQDPNSIRPMFPNGVPAQARTQHMDTPQGSFDVTPLGGRNQIWQPPQGYTGGNPFMGPGAQSPTPNGTAGPAPAMRPIQGGPQDPTSFGNQITNEGKLRDDYEAQIKGYRAAREGYQKVIQAAQTGTPAGDIALVFGYMKTLDPGSTVREGEQATVQNSGTIPQTVLNMYNQMLTGKGRLSPEQRQQFTEAAGKQFGVYQQSLDALNGRYAGMAQSYGLDPSHVVQSFTPIEAPKSQADPRVQFLMQNRGMGESQARKALSFLGSKAPQGTEQNPFITTSEGQYANLPHGAWYIFTDGTVQRKP